ncbi:MAG: cytochrome C peroxidase, partial [Myxococcales bacterium]|nr:cytochrome C peroxidase [Myxococcales bacterium]
GRPAWDAADAAVIERGAAEFEAACAECHPAPLYADGLRHAVAAPSEDPDGRLEAVDTPTLRGVRGRAPFLHDGRAADLAAAVAAHAEVTVGDLPALVRYLESL